MKAKYKSLTLKENKWNVINRICDLLNIEGKNQYRGMNEFAFELYKIKTDVLQFIEKRIMTTQTQPEVNK